jgi:hypothetical protein
MIAPDFSAIGAGLDAAPIIALILVGGTIVVGVGFGIWTSGSVGRFFSASGDPMKDKSSPEYRAWYEEQMRAEREQIAQRRREHPEEYRPRPAASASSSGRSASDDESPRDSWGVADAIALGAVAAAAADDSTPSSASSDFSGGGGDFGGGGSSSDW